MSACPANRAIKSTSTTLLFQVLSDLHLEVGQDYAVFDFPVTAPHLILAGDIGLLSHYDAYLDFISKQTARYDRVFLVLGNHEFYGLDFAKAHATARRLEKEPCLQGKLSYLQQTRFDFPAANLTILGCTLWSHVPNDAKEVVRQRVKDFRRIEDWTVDNHNRAHASDVAWLKAELAKLDPGQSVLVVTHHAPLVLGTSKPEHLENPWTSAFATDVLSDDETWDVVKYWIYGHTHYSTEFEMHGTRVVSNQRGYVIRDAFGVKKRNRGFNMHKTIKVALEKSENFERV
ncbi:hypothetical protein PFICI_14219 [Pestalotiopsis fici W106-1]|uniref:Calcineurin-like phosphoesterase domain-containing protein n=1 Tax=Pestalotiopsis fici (strain W106-1 / CGMCC3.15140) TaxID=1229662 RepID=W3WKF7_PESFW|nr:uncharacterized protein PFICI_14219 [Pestalotiopsis fici W106-1]ETS74353.1 hypothetical protein PFICI_14219 [Pestalotiopsis fici W106-1]